MTEDGLRPRRFGLLLGIAGFAFTMDLITKVLVVAKLEGHDPIELPGGLLQLQVTRNSGAAFSIGSGLTLLFTLIATGVVIYILRTARRLRSVPWAVTLGLLLGGATGNLLDRLLRAPAPLHGHVVDWIELPHFPVFNLADSAIVCGGVIAVWLAARGIQIDGTQVDGTERAGEAGRDGPDTADALDDTVDSRDSAGSADSADSADSAANDAADGADGAADAGRDGAASRAGTSGGAGGTAAAPGGRGAEKS